MYADWNNVDYNIRHVMFKVSLVILIFNYPLVHQMISFKMIDEMLRILMEINMTVRDKTMHSSDKTWHSGKLIEPICVIAP